MCVCVCFEFRVASNSIFSKGFIAISCIEVSRLAFARCNGGLSDSNTVLCVLALEIFSGFSVYRLQAGRTGKSTDVCQSKVVKLPAKAANKRNPP